MSIEELVEWCKDQRTAFDDAIRDVPIQRLTFPDYTEDMEGAFRALAASGIEDVHLDRARLWWISLIDPSKIHHRNTQIEKPRLSFIDKCFAAVRFS